jgi:hypothetical protein
MHIFVDNADQRQPQIEAVLAAENISIANFRRTAPRMEEAFISLIARMEEENA